MSETENNLYAALFRAGQWLALIDKGFKQGKIPDQTILDTNGDESKVGMTPLSEIIEREVGNVSAALAQARGEPS